MTMTDELRNKIGLHLDEVIGLEQGQMLACTYPDLALCYVAKGMIDKLNAVCARRDGRTFSCTVDDACNVCICVK